MIKDPRIVLFDLETLPDLMAALEVWPQLSNYPGLTLKAQVSSVICFGYSVFGSGEFHVKSAWDYRPWEVDVNNDGLLLMEAYEILKDADAVVTQNGKRFDWKFFQTRLMKHGLPLLPKIHHIDTKQLASKNLYLSNNRLDNIAEQLTDKRKVDHEGWPLWVKTYHRDPDAMKRMSEYCKGDVIALDAIFRRLRPFAMNMPNHNLHSLSKVNLCPACGSSRLKSYGWRSTSTQTYRRYNCMDCGAWSRTDKTDRNPRAI